MPPMETVRMASDHPQEQPTAQPSHDGGHCDGNASVITLVVSVAGLRVMAEEQLTDNWSERSVRRSVTTTRDDAGSPSRERFVPGGR